MRTLIGYLRYDSPEELDILHHICRQQSLLTNYFLPQQKLIGKTRQGAKVIKKYDTAQTPYQRLLTYNDNNLNNELHECYDSMNPAEIQRQLQKLINNLTETYITKNQRKNTLQSTPTDNPKQT